MEVSATGDFLMKLSHLQHQDKVDFIYLFTFVKYLGDFPKRS